MPWRSSSRRKRVRSPLHMTAKWSAISILIRFACGYVTHSNEKAPLRRRALWRLQLNIIWMAENATGETCAGTQLGIEGLFTVTCHNAVGSCYESSFLGNRAGG